MYGGRNPQTFPVSKTWEECFSKGLDNIFDMEEKVQGADEEMRQLREGLMTKVIPRLLRPLETEGRTLIPTLVHGDMWQGNVAVDKATGRPIIFDATPLYAHHECKQPIPRHGNKQQLTVYVTSRRDGPLVAYSPSAGAGLCR
jgi:fructosamine-3-kinase